MASRKPLRLGPFTIPQLDRGCAVRREQDYRSEMGRGAPPIPPYETLSNDEKHELRFELLQILKVMT